MTLYRRIKDYCDRRKAHYHLERVAFPSEEPTEEDLRGEDGEAITLFLSPESLLPKDLTDKLKDKEMLK